MHRHSIWIESHLCYTFNPLCNSAHQTQTTEQRYTYAPPFYLDRITSMLHLQPSMQLSTKIVSTTHIHFIYSHVHSTKPENLYTDSLLLHLCLSLLKLSTSMDTNVHVCKFGVSQCRSNI